MGGFYLGELNGEIYEGSIKEDKFEGNWKYI